jgi:nucleotide-binding universal stress UspA family protein
MIDLRRILVPTDFSKSSRNALVYAVAFAEKFNATIHLLHVVQDLALFIPEAVLPAPPLAPPVEQFAAAAREALHRAIHDLEKPGISIYAEISQGVTAEEIIAFAREHDIDLIVMGTHGHTGLAHVFLGSIAEKVVRRGPCPVLTVRHPEHEFVHP